MKPLFVCFLLLILLIPTPAQATSPGSFRVYLTFEDGPTDAYTPQILDILAAHQAKATFFVNGWQEGHATGNHLWEEPGHYAGASDEVVRESYFKTEEAIRVALGNSVSIYDSQVKLYRQPGGGAEPFPAQAGESIITYNWNVSGNDCGSEIADADGRILDADVLNLLFGTPYPGYSNIYDYGDGVVIALHDINRVTGRILPTLIEQLQQTGATFEALPRPWDSPGTMPVVLGAPPVTGTGITGATMPGQTVYNSHLRAAPSTASEILMTIPVKTPLIFIGPAPDWYQIEFEGKIGWIYAENVTIFGPIPNLPLISRA